jgi:hypothetical protein
VGILCCTLLGLTAHGIRTNGCNNKRESSLGMPKGQSSLRKTIAGNKLKAIGERRTVRSEEPTLQEGVKGLINPSPQFGDLCHPPWTGGGARGELLRFILTMDPSL